VRPAPRRRLAASGRRRLRPERPCRPGHRRTPAAAAAAGAPAHGCTSRSGAAPSTPRARRPSAAASHARRHGRASRSPGYTDATGNLTANQELAKNRATAVRDALVAAGVGADRIEMRPPASVEANAVGGARAARRVEVTRIP
jgi:hypothetical protein